MNDTEQMLIRNMKWIKAITKSRESAKVIMGATSKFSTPSTTLPHRLALGTICLRQKYVSTRNCFTGLLFKVKPGFSVRSLILLEIAWLETGPDTKLVVFFCFIWITPCKKIYFISMDGHWISRWTNVAIYVDVCTKRQLTTSHTMVLAITQQLYKQRNYTTFEYFPINLITYNDRGRLERL